MNGFIYKITNRVNNKVYIGQTRFTIEHRFKQHIKNYNIEHRKQALYLAFDKYGIENFVVEQVEECPIEKLDEREIYWIAYYDSFKNGYNSTLGGKSGCKYFFTDNQYEEIRNLYLSGFTIKKIAQLYNVSSETMRSLLKTMKIKMRNNPLDMNKYEETEFINNYNSGYTLTTLAKQYNTDKQTVKRFLISKGVTIRRQCTIDQNEELKEQLVQDYLNGVTYRDLEIKYHSDSRHIKKILVEHGIDLKEYRGLKRTNKGSFCLTDEQCLEAIKMYNDNIKVRDIANKFNIHICTVYELLKKYHVKCKRYNCSKSVHTLKKGEDVLQ